MSHNVAAAQPIHIVQERRGHMQDKEKILSKLKGLKALADRGVDGEKIAAQKMLEKFMCKHGITEGDLGVEQTECSYFAYKGEIEKKLLVQVVYSVLGDSLTDLYPLKGKLGFYTTIAQRVEIEIKFDFYKKAWKEELAFFYKAFVSKNDIIPPDDLVKNETVKDVSASDALKIALMMEGLETRNPALRLE